MELSKRLQAVADLVSGGLTVADVGTDHGYIPIYLVEQEKCKKAFALDVNKGPLLRAKEHIAQHELENRIETRLSDGVKALSVGECDCVIIAGMGGALTIKIMEEGRDVFQSLKEFVLQPQSELAKVRKYLCDNHYIILKENIVLEDGKYYPMMKVKSGEAQNYTQAEMCYGKCLLADKNLILKQFLEKEVRTKEKILSDLQSESSEHIQNRIQELQEELALVNEALQVYL